MDQLPASAAFIVLTGSNCSSAILREEIKTNINGLGVDSACLHNPLIHTDNAVWLNSSHGDMLITILLVIVYHLASKYIYCYKEINICLLPQFYSPYTKKTQMLKECTFMSNIQLEELAELYIIDNDS